MRNYEKINANIVNGYSKEITLPIIQKISGNGKEILLSDDSVWISRSHGFKNWQQGNHIIASSLKDVSIDTSTHISINIDK